MYQVYWDVASNFSMSEPFPKLPWNLSFALPAWPGNFERRGKWWTWSSAFRMLWVLDGFKMLFSWLVFVCWCSGFRCQVWYLHLRNGMNFAVRPEASEPFFSWRANHSPSASNAAMAAVLGDSMKSWSGRNQFCKHSTHQNQQSFRDIAKSNGKPLFSILRMWEKSETITSNNMWMWTNKQPTDYPRNHASIHDTLTPTLLYIPYLVNYIPTLLGLTIPPPRLFSISFSSQNPGLTAEASRGTRRPFLRSVAGCSGRPAPGLAALRGPLVSSGEASGTRSENKERLAKQRHGDQTNIIWLYRRPCLALAKAGRRPGPPSVWSFALSTILCSVHSSHELGTPPSSVQWPFQLSVAFLAVPAASSGSCSLLPVAFQIDPKPSQRLQPPLKAANLRSGSRLPSSKASNLRVELCPQYHPL